MPTKVHLFIAMVFPVVMYRCKNWTIKRLSAKEVVLSNYGAGKKFLSVAWTARRSNQSILKETNPEYSLNIIPLQQKVKRH